VVSLALLGADGAILDGQAQAHTTQAYNYTSFSPPLLTLSDTLTSQGVDRNGNGKYGLLEVALTVTVGDAGTVIAQGRLADGAGETIGWAESLKFITAGSPQVIKLTFKGQDILNHAVNGPYHLHDLLVYHVGDPEQAQTRSLAHTTAAYAYTQFELESLPVFLPLLFKNSSPDVICIDHFDDPSSGWWEENLGTHSWSYQGGEYQMMQSVADKWMATRAPCSYAGNYSLEADMRRLSGGLAGYGLLFDLVDWDNYYLFMLATSGNYTLLIRVGGSWSYLINWTGSTSINADAGTNHLKVERSGSQIRLFVNGVFLNSVTDDTFHDSEAGLYMQTGATVPVTVRYDNYRLRRLTP